jgi:cell division protein FtsB
MSPDDGDTCSCDVCAQITAYHTLSAAEKFATATRHLAKDWKQYAEQLEAENYELEQEVTELREELSAERARCQGCGRHK